jgi:hypothetical protein
MPNRIGPLLFAIVAAFAALPVQAATPEAEKQFVDAYKKAFEAKDAKGLNALLYTKGADPQALEFYKMMMVGEPNAKLVSIKLLDLGPDDKARLANGKTPDGKPMKLSLPATKKLELKTESKSKDGSSSGTSSVFVGEADGKLWIPVPAASK